MPVKRGLSAPNIALRTQEWMPSAPINAPTRTSLPSVKEIVTPLSSAAMRSARLASATRSAGNMPASAASRSARWIVSCGAP